MERRTGRVIRKGNIYRFTSDGAEYAAFIWEVGRRFCGRVEGHPQVPEIRGATALAVRDALSSWLLKAHVID